MSYGVMVAQQFLVLFVVVRIRLGQHNEGFLFIEEAFVVLRRKGENCGTSLMCVVFPKTQRGR